MTYPGEIEAALLRVEGVQEAAVVGRPDEHWGEAVHAFVVEDAEVEVIATAMTAELSAQKGPKGYTRINELPRNATGKVLRLELGRYLEQTLSD
ncbi:AMP-binding enzyme [Umezakia ovalisporum]|uniref:AMP-binding enzyme n=1 Tax=Umezakia ovalisporum TaxID=75695 RepID=UPI0039C69A98